MDTANRWSRSRARAFLLFFLVLFAVGRLSDHLRRPVIPECVFESADDKILPEPGIRLLDISRVRTVNPLRFPSGTTVEEAVGSLDLRTVPRGSGRVLPRAGVLVRKGQGWKVRTMSQRERAVWRIPLDVNSCSIDDLTGIPGIGPTLAERIYLYVSRRVWIRAVSDLIAVRGIGPGKLKVLERYLEVTVG